MFQRYPQIRGTVSPEFTDHLGLAPLATPSKAAAATDRLALAKGSRAFPIRGTVSPESTGARKNGAPTPLAADSVLRFSWSQLQELVRIDDPWKRAFFENECLDGNWSVRQLQRQIESMLYERTGLSTDKRAVIERARGQAPHQTIADLLRDPYVLEFTGLADLPSYSEDQFESVLLDHLQRFLLELGRGFCFEARQFRMTEERKNHRVDLVFYNRLLRCHVLVELKVRGFRPADAGQMNFYVNWFKANMMAEGDAPPVGILLCRDKDGAEVEFATAGMDQKLFVSHYLTALPAAEKLRAVLEVGRERIESATPGQAAPAKRPRRKAPASPEAGKSRKTAPARSAATTQPSRSAAAKPRTTRASAAPAATTPRRSRAAPPGGRAGRRPNRRTAA